MSLPTIAELHNCVMRTGFRDRLPLRSGSQLLAARMPRNGEELQGEEDEEPPDFRSWDATALSTGAVSISYTEEEIKAAIPSDILLRPGTVEFCQHLDAFVEIKGRVEGAFAEVIQKKTVLKYENIKPPFDLVQDCVPEGAPLKEQLDALYACAPDGKKEFDAFCRGLVGDIGLDPDKIMLEQVHVDDDEQVHDKIWRVYTEVPLKKRDRAEQKAHNEYGSNGRQLVDIVRGSIVVDTEDDLEAVVKRLIENYYAMSKRSIVDVFYEEVTRLWTNATRLFSANEPSHDDPRERAVSVVRFKNRFKKPMQDGGRDMNFNIIVTLHDGTRFVCELQIHLKQILDFNAASHIVYEFFRAFFKGSSAVIKRSELLERIAKKRDDTSNMARILTDALHGTDEDELEALADLFHMLSELNIVFVIRRRLVDLAARSEEPDGENSTKFALRLDRLASVLRELGKFEEAATLFERAIAIGEKTLGPEHPDLATRLNNLANLLRAQVRLRRAIEPSHSSVAGEVPRGGASLRARHRHRRENARSRTSGSRDFAQQLRELAARPSAFASNDRAVSLVRRRGGCKRPRLSMSAPSPSARKLSVPNIRISRLGSTTSRSLLRAQVRLRRAIEPSHSSAAGEAARGRASLRARHRHRRENARSRTSESRDFPQQLRGLAEAQVRLSSDRAVSLVRRRGGCQEAARLYERDIAITEKSARSRTSGSRDFAQQLGGTCCAPKCVCVERSSRLTRPSQGRLQEAAPLYERAIAIGEKTLGPEHPDLATRLNNLANLLRDQVRLRRTIEPSHSSVAGEVPRGGASLRARHRHRREIARSRTSESRDFAQQLRRTCCKRPSAFASSDRAVSLVRRRGGCQEAAPLYERAIAIGEKTLGPEHPISRLRSTTSRACCAPKCVCVERSSRLTRPPQGRLPRGRASLRARHRHRRENARSRTSGSRDFAQQLRGLAASDQVRLFRAIEPSHSSAAGEAAKRPRLSTSAIIAIYEENARSRTPGSRDFPQQLRGLAASPSAFVERSSRLTRPSQGRYQEAAPLYERAIAIGEKTLGPEHPDLANWLNNFAVLLWKSNRISEAIPYQERATKIRELRGETDLLAEYRGELDSLKAGRAYPYPD